MTYHPHRLRPHHKSTNPFHNLDPSPQLWGSRLPEDRSPSIPHYVDDGCFVIRWDAERPKPGSKVIGLVFGDLRSIAARMFRTAFRVRRSGHDVARSDESVHG